MRRQLDSGGVNASGDRLAWIEALRAIFRMIERIIVPNLHAPRSPDELAAK